MKTFLLTLVCLLLSACSPNINGAHVERAVRNCEKHGGVASINAPTFFAITDFSKVFTVECVDGVELSIIKIVEKK